MQSSTEKHDQSKHSVVESIPSGNIYKHSLPSGSGKVAEEGHKECKSQITVFCEIVSPRNVRSYTYKVSPILLLKHELKKNDTNGHARLGGEKSLGAQSYIKN